MYNRAYQRSLRPRKLEVSASYTCLSLMWGILASHILEAQPVSAWVSSSSPNVREHPDFGDPKTRAWGPRCPLNPDARGQLSFQRHPKHTVALQALTTHYRSPKLTDARRARLTKNTKMYDTFQTSTTLPNTTGIAPQPFPLMSTELSEM